MKIKTTLFIIASMCFGALASNAATVTLANVQGGPGTDMLWAGFDGIPLTSGSVSVGYFTATVTEGDISTVQGLFANLANFTTLQSAVPGSSTNFPSLGYILEDPTTFSPSGLIGRNLYAIATDAASLGAALETSSYSMFRVSPILEDVPFPNDYVANPAGGTIIIGTVGSWTGTTDFGEGTYSTLQLVPEPSAALLGALGALGLLRRRRI
jgi:hypothetical protein